MFPKNLLFFAVAASLFCKSYAEEVEMTGTYSIQLSCGGNYHESVPVIKVPGNDGVGWRAHALDLDPETRKQFRVGQTVTVKGQKRPFMKKKLSKGQLRKAMVQALDKGEGIPYHGEEVAGVLSKIEVVKPAPKGPRGLHDHGELELRPLEDDGELVEVYMREHIAVSRIEAAK